MSYLHFRATIDFTVFEDRSNARALARRLLAQKGDRIADERLGQQLSMAIEDGLVEIDAISNIEDHGKGG